MASGIFTDELKNYYGAEEGAFSTITAVEIEKQTYNVKACIRKMMIARVGRAAITPHGSSASTIFQLSPELAKQYGKTSESFICKFSKPNKDEMTIYFSKGDFIPKSSQDSDDIWCIYYLPGSTVPHFDFVKAAQWNVISNQSVGGTSIEPDEVSRDTSGKIETIEYSTPVSGLIFHEESAPLGSGTTSRKKRKKQTSIVSTTDLSKILKNQKIKGTRGEEIVVQIEKQDLINIGHPELARKVKWVAKNAYGYGYDIESFSVDPVSGDASKIYIEVKTTSLRSKTAPFYVSKNELKASEEKGNAYFLYRIYGLSQTDPNVHYFKIRGKLDQSLVLEPDNYIATLR